ncbi:hypothetical protein [Streptomyces sp. NPDC008137]
MTVRAGHEGGVDDRRDVVVADLPVADKPPVEQESEGGGDRDRVTS